MEGKTPRGPVLLFCLYSPFSHASGRHVCHSGCLAHAGGRRVAARGCERCKCGRRACPQPARRGGDADVQRACAASGIGSQGGVRRCLICVCTPPPARDTKTILSFSPPRCACSPACRRQTRCCCARFLLHPVAHFRVSRCRFLACSFPMSRSLSSPAPRQRVLPRLISWRSDAVVFCGARRG